jgi:hypothetical protein
MQKASIIDLMKQGKLTNKTKTIYSGNNFLEVV